MLDTNCQRLLFKQENMGFRHALDWCLTHCYARENRTKDLVREGKVEKALKQFRGRIDKFVTTGNGPQEEGFAHQKILEIAFRELRYHVTNNSSGVPDFNAHLTIYPACNRRSPRRAIEKWKPSTKRLKRIRTLLKGANKTEIDEFMEILNGNYWPHLI